MEKMIRVFVVDDHPLMRSAIELAIETEPNMEVVGEAIDGEEALALIPILKPDIVIMDLMIPKVNGWEATAALKLSQDAIPVLVFSSDTDKENILRAIRLGAQGYISKDARREELIDAVRMVAEGKAYLPPKIAGKLLQGIRRPPTTSEGAKKSPRELTPRQQEILDLLGQGLPNTSIAEKLHISKATLRVHIHHMVEKLSLENRRALVVYAVRKKIIEEDGGSPV